MMVQAQLAAAEPAAGDPEGGGHRASNSSVLQYPNTESKRGVPPRNPNIRGVVASLMKMGEFEDYTKAADEL